MFSSTGQGLDVLISCDCCYHHNWMAFACWSSLNRNAPDAQVAVLCKRATAGNYFSWAGPCGVRFSYHAGRPGDRRSWQAQVAMEMGLVKSPFLVLEPDVLAVRELPLPWTGSVTDPDDRVWYCQDEPVKPATLDPGLCVAARSEDFATFVSYREGWGKFVTADCIDKREYPFRRPDRLHSGDVMTLNEIRILDLWKRMDRLFTAVSRG